MTDSRRTKPQPITIARIERAMDILAHWMVKLGDDGVKCLPIYERLEMELEQLSSTESKMAEVFARAGRLKDQNPKPQRQIFVTPSQRNNETEHHIQVRAKFD